MDPSALQECGVRGWGVTDGENAIAPEVPELIKKQDHTPVRSRGGSRGGREAAESRLKMFHLGATRRSDAQPSSEDPPQLAVCACWRRTASDL